MVNPSLTGDLLMTDRELLIAQFNLVGALAERVTGKTPEVCIKLGDGEFTRIFEEIAASQLVVHGGPSGSRVAFSPIHPAEGTAASRRRPGANSVANQEKPGETSVREKASTNTGLWMDRPGGGPLEKVTLLDDQKP
jgi:hypothetical protein